MLSFHRFELYPCMYPSFTVVGTNLYPLLFSPHLNVHSPASSVSSAHYLVQTVGITEYNRDF